MFVAEKINTTDLEQEGAKREAAATMADRNVDFSHGTKLRDGRHTGGDEEDVEIVGVTGDKLPHNRFCCSEVRESTFTRYIMF